MEIRCKHCGEYFCPSDDTLDLIEEGFIDANSCNVCNDCWDMIQLSEFDYYEEYSYADPGL
jgi:hypothetical protein